MKAGRGGWGREAAGGVEVGKQRGGRKEWRGFCFIHIITAAV